MVSKVYTVAFKGIEALEILTEVQLSSGLPAFQIVGLPDKAVAESRERIRACFQSLTLSFPLRRIVVNLAPADLQKEGSHYDLPIALALLGEMNIVSKEILQEHLALGELGLDGRLCRAQGVLSAALYASQEKLNFICPFDNASEASWSGHPNVIAPKGLLNLINHFQGRHVLESPITEAIEGNHVSSFLDMSDIKGQALGRRALEIAASGGHHMLMIGPPGVGKSMLAHRLPGLLPPLSAKQALAVTMIYSVNGSLPKEGLITKRPFRDPHHSTSPVALVGGGHRCQPGEISLAHHGVLFMDEFPEFNRQTLESLRQPLETKRISIARANYHVTYPADIQLIAAMNPCRCGFFYEKGKQCHKVPQCFLEYRNKISGPLMDRFDLIVYLDNISSQDLLKLASGESSKIVACRVQRTRHRQEKSRNHLNSSLDGQDLNRFCTMSDSAKDLIAQSMDKGYLSARGMHRLLRVSRTIADMEDQVHQELQRHHVLEALSYRQIENTAL